MIAGRVPCVCCSDGSHRDFGRPSNEHEGHDREQECHRVDPEPERRASHRDRHAGECRPDHARDRHAAHDEGVRRLEPILRHEPWDEREGGRLEEGIGGAESGAEHVQVPQLDRIGPDQQRQDGHERSACRARRDHDPAGVVAVAERPANEHEGCARDRRGHQHEAQGKARAGHGQRQPRQGDEVELVAQHRDRFAQPHHPERAVPERLNDAEALNEAGHVTVVRGGSGPRRRACDARGYVTPPRGRHGRV